MAIFTGSGVALVTPFTDEGLNLAAYRALIDYQLDNGTDALIACGTTGEPSTMSMAEREAAIECAVEHAAGRVPVVAGCGGNNTRETVEAAKRCAELGADALLVVTPYYNKTTQAGLVRHFGVVADATDLPIIVYNVPVRTGLNLQPATLFEIAKHPNIQGVKEASADISQIAEVARLCPDLPLYSGNDDHVVPVLSLGGLGVISVTANICPRQVHEMCKKWFEGDVAGAREIQLALNPLTKCLFMEVSPIPVKAAVSMLGIDAGPVRLPLVPVSEGLKGRIREEMEKLGVV